MFASGSKIIQAFYRLLASRVAFPIVSPEVRVSQIITSILRNPYIVGAVEQLAAEVGDEYPGIAFRIECPELIVHICTSYQVALGIEVHSVGATALIGEHRYLSGFAVPTVNHIVGLVGKIDITLCVCSWPFSKAIRIGNLHRDFPFGHYII